MNASFRNVIVTIVRLTAGGVLTVASISKVFSFHQFAAGLPRLTGVPVVSAAALAGCVIALECASGLLLVSGKSLRVAGIAAVSLFVGFVFVLSAAVVRGIEPPCNCFGILGPDLPLRGQALVDMMLAAAAVFVIRSTGEHTTSKKTRGIRVVAVFAALVWGGALLAWPEAVNTGNVRGDSPSPVESGIDTGRHDRPSVLLLADFDDFGCRLCLDDFLAFCDSLNVERYRSAVSIRLIARRDTSRTAAVQERIVSGWAAGNGYRFSVSVDSESVFERSGVGKTSAIILASDGKLIDVAHFPLGGLRRLELLRAIVG